MHEFLGICLGIAFLLWQWNNKTDTKAIPDEAERWRRPSTFF